MKDLLLDWEELLRPVVILGVAVVLGLIAHYVIFKIFRTVSERTKSTLGTSFVKHCRAPSRVIIPLVVIHLLLPLVAVSPNIGVFLNQAFSVVLILSVAWLIIKLAYVGEDIILSQYRVDVKDNLQARKIHTQIQMLKRVVMVVVGVLALAVVLMTFDKVRQLGTSILASAGIAGIIIGFAAQRTIATLLAGFQIAMTGPIRIDDVVIVENEWGRIEEITLTYVVVRIWDLRRLVVPITYFLEKPFQNWTRVSADLLGAVFLYVDYTVPTGEIREQLHQIVKSSDKWDGKVCVLQVTNSTERTVELRALVSASDSSSAWELRCIVREKLIEFVQRNYPDSLPKMRAEFRQIAQ